MKLLAVSYSYISGVFGVMHLPVSAFSFRYLVFEAIILFVKSTSRIYGMRKTANAPNTALLIQGG